MADAAAKIGELLHEAAGLTSLLVRLDREFVEKKPGGRWADHYAVGPACHFFGG